MTEQRKIEFKRPFGPSIAKVQMTNELISKINHYVDAVIIDDEKSKKQDFGKHLAGNVKQEIILDEEFVKSSGLMNFLTSAVNAWIKNVNGETITKFVMISCWVVRQFENEYNPLHLHSGYISGVGYLKVPKDFGETYQEEKVNSNGKIAFVHGTRQFLSKNVEIFKPVIGDFYFFPNYLTHAVYPFRNNANEERRSISFNAKIDESIYDVYGKK